MLAWSRAVVSATALVAGLDALDPLVLALLRGPLAFVSQPLTLVSPALALVGRPLALVGRLLAPVGLPVARVRRVLAARRAALALLDDARISTTIPVSQVTGCASQ